MLKKSWVKILFIILMFLCYWCAAMTQIKLEKETENKACAAILSGKMNKEEADRIVQTENKQDQPVYFNLWGEKENETVENTELERTVTVEAFFVYNGTQLLFPGMTALEANDINGCLIDQKTAVDLFGSIDIVGQKLVYHNRVLIVRQVIPHESRILVLLADGKETVLDNIAIENPNKKASNIETFLTRHGIDGRLQDFSLLADLARAAACILPFWIGIQIFITMLKYEGNGKKNVKIFMKAGAFIVLLLLALGIFHYIKIPSEMIPTKWSDFDFWIQLFEKKQEAFLFLMQTAKSQGQIGTVLCFWQSLGFNIGSIILYFLGFHSGFHSK